MPRAAKEKLGKTEIKPKKPKIFSFFKKNNQAKTLILLISLKKLF
jgi:hypothetical protein